MIRLAIALLLTASATGGAQTTGSLQAAAAGASQARDVVLSKDRASPTSSPEAAALPAASDSSRRTQSTGDAETSKGLVASWITAGLALVAAIVSAVVTWKTALRGHEVLREGQALTERLANADGALKSTLQGMVTASAETIARGSQALTERLANADNSLKESLELSRRLSEEAIESKKLFASTYETRILELRLVAYAALWQSMRVVSKERSKSLQPSGADAFLMSLEKWYYDSGMLLSENSRTRWIEARDTLAATSTFDEQSTQAVFGAFSTLRTALCDDIATRRAPGARG